MAAPTVVVSVNVSDQDGAALQNATVKATLIGTDVYNNELIAQIDQEVLTDATGLAQLSLFPNALGTKGTYYRFIVNHPVTGKKITDVTAIVPNAAVNLTQIANNLRAELTTPAVLAQAQSPVLTSLASLVTAANKLPYFTGVNSFALTDFTAAGRSLVAAASLAAASALLPGPFLAADGSAAAPSYSFSGQTSTGVYKPFNNYVGISTAGTLVAAFNSDPGLQLLSTVYLGWVSAGGIGSNPDVLLHRDAANVLALRNATSAQSFRVYGTFTDASNYDRISISKAAGSTSTIASEAAGTGVAAALRLIFSQVVVNISGDKYDFISTYFGPAAGNDNLRDLGASGLRWRSLYWGTQALAPAGTVSAPAYAFDVDTDMGLWRRATDALDVAIGGRNVLDIQKSDAFGDYLGVGNNSRIGWAGSVGAEGSPDLVIRRDAANVLAQRNGTNPQTFRLYNTFTDGSNNENIHIYWNSNVARIVTAASGTGTVRNLIIGGAEIFFRPGGISGTDAWKVNASGHFLAVADNTYDIGTTGAARPRTGYFAGTLSFGTHSALAAESVTGFITITDAGGTSRKLAVVS